MERSAEIIALDKDLLSAMRQIEVKRPIFVRQEEEDTYALFERCQKIIRSNPEYSHFYASVPNDFAYLPADVILDVISICQPFAVKRRYNGAIEANSFFVDANFFNMAKIDGKWGEESRKLDSLVYERGVIKRTFFDVHGEIKSEEVEATGLGRNMVHASYLSDRDNVEGVANNLSDEIYLEVTGESLYLTQLMKPRFTSITFEVSDNPSLEEFVSIHLKSKTLRKLLAKGYGKQGIGSSWADQLAQFVLRDDFLELQLNSQTISGKSLKVLITSGERLPTWEQCSA
ncbi:hypothetical protein QR680_015105 [Steinernema hermaphroditum]|uniref:Uncharacterized protein n=1 Tax=Steinernema hermaphroditum TaxID=289476 RepID=A0AA39IDS0_9BILA|nr:hypothetical protein QR680_015105 [Steinernema hermaphroditum]